VLWPSPVLHELSISNPISRSIPQTHLVCIEQAAERPLAGVRPLSAGKNVCPARVARKIRQRRRRRYLASVSWPPPLRWLSGFISTATDLASFLDPALFAHARSLSPRALPVDSRTTIHGTRTKIVTFSPEGRRQPNAMRYPYQTQTLARGDTGKIVQP